MKFELLVDAIAHTHSHFQQQACKAINVSLTLRNWLIGYYIIEFEQNGEDRAAYGTGLLNKLAIQLNIKGLVSAELSRCRQFYRCYPQILGSLTQELQEENIAVPIRGILTTEPLVVSKYLLELPKKEQLEAFILNEMKLWK
jgi:hypothetical protein